MVNGNDDWDVAVVKATKRCKPHLIDTRDIADILRKVGQALGVPGE